MSGRSDRRCTPTRRNQSVSFLFPKYTRTERLVDGLVHAIGVVLSVVAVVVLLGMAIPPGDALSIFCATVFGIGLVAMFGFSAAYHWIDNLEWKAAIRSYDHAAIYLLIAGTYTPFALISIGGAAGYSLLALVWLLAIAGALGRLLRPKRLDHNSAMMYLALGWVGLPALGLLIVALPTSTLLLIGLGGLLYSVGVVFHLWDSLPFQNAVWHSFVLSAASCHFVAVVSVVAV